MSVLLHEKIRKAIDLKHGGRLAEARALFNECIAEYPTDEWSRLELSNCYQRPDEAEEKLQILKEGIKSLPKAPHLKASLGLIKLAAGMTDQAVSIFNDSNNDMPNAQAFLGLTTLALQNEGLQAGAAWFERAEAALVDPHRLFFYDEYLHLFSVHFKDNVNIWQKPREPGRPIDNACMIFMLKDEGDIIAQQLKRSYETGFRRFFIFDNNSNDNTRNEVSNFRNSYPDCTMAILEDTITAYEQSKKMTLLADYAIRYSAIENVSIDWIFPLDADEFIALPPSGPDLAEILSNAQQNNKLALSFMLSNAGASSVLDQLPQQFDPDELFDRRAPFGTRAACKMAFRPSSNFVIHQGNHFVSGVVNQGSDIVHMSELGAYLSHYPNRSIAQMRSKFTNGGKALAASPNIPGGAHWRVSYARLQQEGDEFLRSLLNSYIVHFQQRPSAV